jgi:hypothetical protein
MENLISKQKVAQPKKQNLTNKKKVDAELI